MFARDILRTKPGRSDLPLNKRSCSLSCSDKIMAWALLGVQGQKLFQFYLPIYIDRLVVEANEKVSLLGLHQSIDIRYRLSQILHRT
jgi:hypothetical protein